MGGNQQKRGKCNLRNMKPLILTKEFRRRLAHNMRHYVIVLLYDTSHSLFKILYFLPGRLIYAAIDAYELEKHFKTQGCNKFCRHK